MKLLDRIICRCFHWILRGHCYEPIGLHCWGVRCTICGHAWTEED